VTCPPTPAAARRAHGRSPGRPPRQRRPARGGGAGSLARKVVAMLQSGDSITVTGDGLRPVTSGLADKAGPKVRSAAARWCARAERPQGRLGAHPGAGGRRRLRALDPHRRHPRPGGRVRLRKSKFNHVTQAWRQPGSSFKPFIYSAALEQGFTPGHGGQRRAAVLRRRQTGSQPWEPKNYDGKFEGPMPLRPRWPSRRTWSRSACCSPPGRPLRRNGWSASASTRQAPGLPDDGAGRRRR
jgi:hypothetical protein